MRFKLFFVLSSLLVSLTANLAFADVSDVECLADGRAIEVNNEQVLNWKETTENQFKTRANVKGHVVQVLKDATGHDHFILQIGELETDIIEVVYNQEFGGIPEIELGEEIQACGDYITSNAKTKKYLPSPAGAIIHWVHLSPHPERHESGFLIIKGQLCGQENP